MKLLALDTSTEACTVALEMDGEVRERFEVAPREHGRLLLPMVHVLLAEAEIGVAGLDAIAFGRGPGAFTGLRTACSVAQGLALGAAKPVLPIDTLLAIAEDARGDHADVRIWGLLDARMDQIYAAEYAHAGGRWTTRVAPFLTDAEALTTIWREAPPALLAGNALAAFGARLHAEGATRRPDASPGATALLRVAERQWADGAAVDPALALPLYVRDRVADTEAERAARRAATA
jgi:tRNA threonylcarbamoyladenosine biosynthesis protein TsaB